MATACSPACGFCGGCTDKWEYPDERHHPALCDWCNKLIWPGDELYAHYGGRFCSDECATEYGISVEAGDVKAGERAI